MPDEAFEAFWTMPGGQGLIALHELFSGMTVSLDQVQKVLELTQEQTRLAIGAARQLGILETDNKGITFYLLAADSSQRGRLDWCLEPHAAELPPLLAKYKTLLLMRFLGTPPAAP